MIPKFPDYLPELAYSGDEQLRINDHSFKHWLVSKLFYKRVERDGLIYIQYKGNEELEFLPLFNMTKALAYYNDFVEEKKSRQKEIFLNITEELISRATKEKRFAGWKHKKGYYLPGYPPIKKSYSALYQARGLSLLLRYQELSGKDMTALIQGILETFRVSSDEGGVLLREDDEWWYLEYSYGNTSPVVFNGFMSSLISLWEVAEYGSGHQKKVAKELFEKGFDTLERNLDSLVKVCGPLVWFRYDNNKLFLADGSYGSIMIR